MNVLGGPLYDSVTGTGQVSYPDDVGIKVKCNYCEKSFSDKDIDNHIQGRHGRMFKGNEKVRCDFCDKKVKRIGMKSHLISVHGIE